LREDIGGKHSEKERKGHELERKGLKMGSTGIHAVAEYKTVSACLTDW
jgi:hypothetical protein